MIIYVFILFLLIFSSAIDVFGASRKNKDFFFFISFMLFFFVVSLRDGIGVDYYQYQELFNLSRPIYDVNIGALTKDPNNIELGYLLFESLVKSLSNSFNVFFIFI